MKVQKKLYLVIGEAMIYVEELYIDRVEEREPTEIAEKMKVKWSHVELQWFIITVKTEHYMVNIQQDVANLILLRTHAINGYLDRRYMQRQWDLSQHRNTISSN